MQIEITKLYNDGIIPQRRHNKVGYNILASQNVWLHARESVKVQTGVAIHIPEGYEGHIRTHPLMLEQGIRIFMGIQILDADSETELLIHLENTSFRSYEIRRFHKIADIVIVKLEEFVAGESWQIHKEDNIGDYCLSIKP